MNKVFLIVLFFAIFQIGFGQSKIDSANKILIRALEKNFERPNYRDIDSSGFALVKITKTQDSIILGSIYYSAPQFNLESNSALILALNRNYKDKFQNNYEVYVPINFCYYKANDSIAPYPHGSEKILEKKVKDLSGKNNSTMATIWAWPIQY